MVSVLKLSLAWYLLCTGALVLGRDIKSDCEDSESLSCELKEKVEDALGENDDNTEQLTRNQTIKKIYGRILDMQLKEGDENLSAINQPGLFTTHFGIHMIDEDNSQMYHLLRQHLLFSYNNSFNTALILIDLLEMERLGTLKLNDNSTKIAWKAALGSMSKNFPEGSAIFDFSGGVPVIGPLGRFMGYKQPIPGGADLNEVWNTAPHFIKEAFYTNTDTILDARVRMPPNIDNTAVMFMTMGLVLENREKRPAEYEMMVNQVTSFNAAAYRMERSVYRPFINFHYDPTGVNPGEPDSRDILDPRGYYCVHPFLKKKLQEATEKGEDPDVRLAVSWLINQQEIIPEVMELIIINANEIDIVVFTSFIRGITTLVLTGADMLKEKKQSNFFTKDLQKEYSDSAEFLLWAVETNMVNDHPDLISLYPERYIGYDHVGKLLQWLRNYKDDDIPYDVIINVRKMLITLVEDYWTKELLDAMVIKEDTQEAYCDGILGTYAGKSWAEDRLCCTAYYADALVSFWTVRDDEKGIVWIENTPSKVKTVAAYSGNYVAKAALDESTSLQGIMYSIDANTIDDEPYRWPVNVHEYLNKTSVEPHNENLVDVDLINLSWNVQGFISDDKYQNMLKQKWFQKKTPLKFQGWNNPENSDNFPYFFSEGLTLSHSALFLSHLEILDRE